MELNNNFSKAPPVRQQGAVLLVGLIMLLLMTIVGLAAIRGSGLQETMAGNMRERTLAFQVAEAGLRDGEEVVTQDLDVTDFEGNTPGLFKDLGVPANDPFESPMRLWSAEEWEDRSVESDVELDEVVTKQPRYLVERLSVLAQKAAESTGSGVDLGSLNASGIEVEYYRVSSRGESPSGTSSAIVQSTYRVR